uniref:Uncharacterized protein n=1 Tax=Tanacetum cinerariifolium TaxID=118510 RepID=A0A6L2N1S9_TANCI|nr:hypothetical protein [Tanacetum cinerariifolium]
MGLPSTLDEGTHKSKPLPEDVRAILLSKDEAQESEKDILGVGDKMDDNPQFDETKHQSPPPQGDKPTSSTTPHPEASDTDSTSDNIPKKYDN